MTENEYHAAASEVLAPITKLVETMTPEEVQRLYTDVCDEMLTLRRKYAPTETETTWRERSVLPSRDSGDPK